MSCDREYIVRFRFSVLVWSVVFIAMLLSGGPLIESACVSALVAVVSLLLRRGLKKCMTTLISLKKKLRAR